jgi:hypothetical protein
LIKRQSWDRYGLKSWIEAAVKRLHRNVLAIALANKLARIAWSVLAHGRGFEASKLQAVYLSHPIANAGLPARSARDRDEMEVRSPGVRENR